MLEFWGTPEDVELWKWFKVEGLGFNDRAVGRDLNSQPK